MNSSVRAAYQVFKNRLPGWIENCRFFENGDREFVSLLAQDSRVREAEIVRLSRIRRNAVMAGAFVGGLGLLTSVWDSGSQCAFYMVLAVVQMVIFYDAQQKVRTLLLAQMMRPS